MVNPKKPIPSSSGPSRSSAPVRSMTGFARISKSMPDNTALALTLKSVNHRYLDLQFHLPNGMDGLEMQWRSVLKKSLLRGHVEVRLSVSRTSSEENAQWNSAAIAAYIRAFRAAALEHGLKGEPDLNVAFQLPGTWAAESSAPGKDANIVLERGAAACLIPAIEALNAMREQEGAALAQELRHTLLRLQSHVDELAGLRAGMQQAYMERLEQKMRELLANLPAGVAPLDGSRILQEVALLAERSDVEEEIARMRAHIAHFEDVLREGGEVGKRLDFLLQEMAREANTTLSKTSGIASRSLRITELGLAMKAEIEKAREQVQNIE
ncbi:MAG TPA: YicC/YloC family endoribonuclease [Acidobacteriaceae bacterium]|nr:YicC/YloC family endoribonuclease [Acidobacteriaceae bacterium]